MDYENMSDFEINKAVAEIKYPEAEDIPTQDEAWVDNDTECQVIMEFGRNGFTFDPCNNPIDAWPIIVENKIGGHWGRAAPGAYFAVSRLEEFAVMDKNPLRATMIVYLMMQDSK